MILEKRIPLTYLFNKIKWDLLVIVAFSAAIHLFSMFVYNPNLPVTVGAFLGTSIALLLSFKLSQSYDRWWEARKIWGSIVNDSRTLTLQLLNFGIKSGEKDHKDEIRKIAYRQIAWGYSLGQNLRKQNPLKGIEVFIPREELQKIKTHNNVPLVLLHYHLADIKVLHQDGFINDYQQIQLDSTITRLCASMGRAECIKSTYFPKSYRLILRFFIYLFLVLLSFSFTELNGFVEIPLLVVIATPFFLLEKIAFNIQDPFENRPTDTAVTAIARTIEINIRQLLGDKDVPEPINPEKFYIL